MREARDIDSKLAQQSVEEDGPPDDVLERIAGGLEAASITKQCHRCGCFQDTVAVLADTPLAKRLSGSLEAARATFVERRYDCLGCQICWPAEALNAAEDWVALPAGVGCLAEVPSRRSGWPPLAGNYQTVRFSAPVAVCTLRDRSLMHRVAEAAPDGLSIVGPLQTENLGIERIIENVVANPFIRVLVLCGEDTTGRVGHFPGQSLMALTENGLDEEGRIVGARGRRPVIRNVPPAVVAHFRRQVRVVDKRGEADIDAIAPLVEGLGAEAPGPVDPVPSRERPVRVVSATPPRELVLDPAGYVVVIPDRRRYLVLAEHYDRRGVLQTVVEGREPAHLVATLLAEGCVTRAEHAAYLGRELTLAQRALRDGTAYVQDRAPEPGPATQRDPARGEAAEGPCGCGSSCGSST